MTTSVIARTPKRHRLEAFASNGVSTDWYLRIVSANRTKIAVTEGYVGKKAGVKRAAQSLVDGLSIPIIRLDIKSVDSDQPIESWVLRARTKAERIDVTTKTPLV